jgi:hypothetical protein
VTFRSSGLNATAAAAAAEVHQVVTPKIQVAAEVVVARWLGRVFPPMLCLPLWTLLLAHPLMAVLLNQ